MKKDREPPDDTEILTVADPQSEIWEATRLFINEFGLPGRVLYPGCGAHVIDHLFPGSECVYVDPAAREINLLRSRIGARATACACTLEEFQDNQQFDLLLSLNSYAPMSEQLEHLRRGGLVLCNNYRSSETRDAERVIASGTCDLCAVITSTGKSLSLITDNFQSYLEYEQIPDTNPSEHRLKNSARFYVFRKN